MGWSDNHAVKVLRLPAAAPLLGLIVAGCASAAPTPNAVTVISPATPPVSAAATSSISGPPVTSPSPSPAPTPSSIVPGVTPPPAVASLGSVPRDCAPSVLPSGMTLHDFGGGFIGTVRFRGRAPVWTLGLPDNGILRLPPVSDNTQRFPTLKVMWIVGPNETQPVTVRGRDRATGSPLWFQVYPSNATADLPSSYTTTLQLDPSAPNWGYAQNSRGDWSIWGIGVGARAAGCYQLSVSSSKGTWTARLAIGG